MVGVGWTLGVFLYIKVESLFEILFDIFGDIFAYVGNFFIQNFVDAVVDKGLECVGCLCWFGVESCDNFGGCSCGALLVIPR